MSRETEAGNAGIGIQNLLGLNALQLLTLLSGQQNRLTLNLSNPPSGGSVASRPVTIVTYKYTVRILNLASTAELPAKFIVRQLHNFHEKLGNLDLLKIRISTTFNTDIYNVSEISAGGYYKGKQKRWLCDGNDLKMMYKVFSNGNCEIPLWCERSVAKEPASSTSSKRALTKRERHEEEVTDIFEDLKERH